MKELLQRIDQEKYTHKLPSIRTLMEEFHVSQATVSQALHQLADLNRIYVKENVGYFVLPNKRNITNSKHFYDFSTTSTSWTDFPLDSYAQCLEIALNNEKVELFRYGPVDGNPELKKLFQKLLEEEQLYFKSNQMLITSGTQQALHLLALTLNDSESFLIEQPTYHLIIKLLERLQIKHATFHRQINQINIDELEKAIQKNQPKYLFLMPRLHNPLGTTMSDSEKQMILKLADKYDFYIIEDDYLSDFERTSKYRTVFELDNNHRVIYLKSFSKIMFPGQRLGLIILPEELIQPFAQLKEVTDIQTNSLSQVIMQTFIESGLYEYHRDKIVERHKTKVEILRHSLKKYLSNYSFPDNYQMHTVIELPNEMNMDKLYHELEKRKIHVDNHKHNYVKNYKQNDKFLRLNTTSIENNQIDSGVALIAESIEKSKPF
jgi:DNA-binding transcriptional MocR family regulator